MKTKGFIRGVPYRIANYGSDFDGPPSDICLFIKAAVKGCFIILFMFALALLFAFGMLDVVMTGWMYAIGQGNGDFFRSEGLLIIVGVFGWVLAGLLAVGLFFTQTKTGVELEKKLSTRSRQKKAEKMAKREQEEPGLFKMWYRSVKDKVCFQINFEDQ